MRGHYTALLCVAISDSDGLMRASRRTRHAGLVAADAGFNILNAC